jgi:hypothetical protein
MHIQVSDNLVHPQEIEELNEKVKELEQKPEFKSFSCLDFRISASELNKAICNLKNGKSPGLDMIYILIQKCGQKFWTFLKILFGFHE